MYNYCIVIMITCKKDRNIRLHMIISSDLSVKIIYCSELNLSYADYVYKRIIKLIETMSRETIQKLKAFIFILSILEMTIANKVIVLSYR